MIMCKIGSLYIAVLLLLHDLPTELVLSALTAMDDPH
jgi:hypothetical protein